LHSHVFLLGEAKSSPKPELVLAQKFSAMSTRDSRTTIAREKFATGQITGKKTWCAHLKDAITMHRYVTFSPAPGTLDNLYIKVRTKDMKL